MVKNYLSIAIAVLSISAGRIGALLLTCAIFVTPTALAAMERGFLADRGGEIFPSTKRRQPPLTENERRWISRIPSYFEAIGDANLMTTALNQRMSDLSACNSDGSPCQWDFYGTSLTQPENQALKRIEIVPVAGSNPSKLNYMRIFLHGGTIVSGDRLNAALAGRKVLPIVSQPLANS
jgi:hypothetical protein